MSPETRAAIDPVTLEVIRNGLTAIAEEMSLVVMRSARCMSGYTDSPPGKTGRWCRCG